jgi:hypothetical protein
MVRGMRNRTLVVTGVVGVAVALIVPASAGAYLRVTR